MRIAYTEGNIVVMRIEDKNHVGIVTNVRKKKNQILGYDVRSERGGGYCIIITIFMYLCRTQISLLNYT